ncbi:MAG: hypothetical protein AAF666_18915 [Pseudomonadota bacterium]
MTDLCPLIRKPFHRSGWSAVAPSEPYLSCADDGKSARYDWTEHGLTVGTRFTGAEETTEEIVLSMTDLAGGKPWAGALPFGLVPSMTRDAVQDLVGPPDRVRENPDEAACPLPYPSLAYDMPGGVRLSVVFRLGQMYGVGLQ